MMLNIYKSQWDYSLPHSSGLGVVVVREENKRIWDRVVNDYILDLYDTNEPTTAQWQEAQHQARSTLQRIFKQRGLDV
jgi:hypothetical protein